MTETEFHAALLRRSIDDLASIIAQERKRLWHPWVGIAITLPVTYFAPVEGWLACGGWLIAMHMQRRGIASYQDSQKRFQQALRKLYGL